MTKDEVYLNDDGPREFRYYHGGVRYGIVVEDSGKFYHIDTPRIPELQQGKRPGEIGFPINLKTISSSRGRNESKPFRPPPVFPLVNPPTVRKLVILGAGASYDLALDQTEGGDKCPLANELFAPRFDVQLQRYPGASAFCPELAHTGDVEAFFQRKWQHVLDHYDPLTFSKILNVQFYLHDLFLQISKKGQPRRSNYHTLVNLAHEYAVRTDEHVLFVNFNYDLLLEQALGQSQNYRFSSISDYVDHHNKKLLLVKPHGSCNFIRRLHPDILQHIPSDCQMNNITVLSQLLYSKKINADVINDLLAGEFDLFENDEIHHAAAGIEHVLYQPQLLLPFKDKDELVMPLEHYSLMQHLLSGIDEILVIGWKGTEATFQKLLKNRLSHKTISVTTVTKGEVSVKTEFEKSIPKAVYKNIPEPQTFSSYMQYLVQNNLELFD